MANTKQDALITLDEIKDFLNITDENSDSILSKLITGQTAAVQTLTDRQLIKNDSITEYHNGDDRDAICLREFPVAEITSVHDDTERNYGASSLIPATDYSVEAESGVLRFETKLGRGIKNVRVVYKAGYEPMPEDVKLAMCYLVSAEFKASRVQVNTREGMQVKQAEIDDLRKQGYALLEPYRRYPNG